MNSFLTEKDLDKIQLLIEKGLNNTEIAEIVGYSANTIGRIRKGEHYMQKKNEKTDGGYKDLMAVIGNLTEVIDKLCLRLEQSRSLLLDEDHLFETSGKYEVEG